MNKKDLSPYGAALLWLGASLSVSGIFSGAVLSVLGAEKGIAAILTGHLIGCGLLFLTARLGGACAAKSQRNIAVSLASENTPLQGILQQPGISIFSGLTAVALISRAALTLRTSSLSAAPALSPLSFGGMTSAASFRSFPAVFFCAVLLFLTALYFSLPSEKQNRLRQIIIPTAAALGICLCGAFLCHTGGFSGANLVSPENPGMFTDNLTDTSSSGAVLSPFRLSFGEAVELFVSASLPWIPVFFVLSAHSRTFSRFAGRSAILYFAAGIFLPVVSLLFVHHKNISGLAEALSFPVLRLFWILFCTLVGVISLCLCIFSAGKISVTIYSSKRNEKAPIFVSLSVAAAAAVFLPEKYLTSITDFVSVFFVPLLCVFTANRIAKRYENELRKNTDIDRPEEKHHIPHSRIKIGENLSVLLILTGFLILRNPEHLNTPAGQTLPFFLLFTAFCTTVQTAVIHYRTDKRMEKAKIEIYPKHKSEIQKNRRSKNIMKFDPKRIRLYAVTDRSGLKNKTLPQAVEEAICGGVTMVQLREKTLADSDFLKSAQEIRKVTDRYGIPLIINDRPDIALACGADGVHMGQEDGSVEEARRILGPDKIIGVSAHNIEEAKEAENAGADYLGVGAVFSTSTKKDTISVTSDLLRKITEAVSIPVAAIGGITAKRIGSLKNTGIHGIAVVSAIFSAEEPKSASEELCAELQNVGIGVDSSEIFPRLAVSGAIFDVDGTILDSMPMWCSVGSRFLQKSGVTPPEDIDAQMVTRTLEESAAIFSETYGIPGTIPQIVDGMIDMVRHDYCYNLQCKPGVERVLLELHEKGIPMYIATATNRDMIEAAFTRLDLLRYFQGIITCGELSVPKTQPDIYFYAAEQMGTSPEETLVFEDVPHAVRSASKAGFPVVSIYDDQSASARKEMEIMSALYLNDYSQWPGI